MFLDNDFTFDIDIDSVILGLLATTLVGCTGDGNTTVPVAPVTPTVVAAPAVVSQLNTLSTNLSVWQNGLDFYQSGMYAAINNTWGADQFGMKIGKDYTQTITYDKNTFPVGVEFVWDYPDKPYGEGNIVYGWPSIAWGNTSVPLSGFNLTGALSQVQNFSKFVQTYDVTLKGDLQYMSLMTDMWLFDKSGKTVGEIVFSTHPSNHLLFWSNPQNFYGSQPGAHSHKIVMDGINYNVLVSTQYQSDNRIIFITPEDPKYMSSKATVDWHAIFDLLDDDHDIHPDWFTKGIELGVEVQAGDGSMLVNYFHVSATYLDIASNSYVTIG